MLREVEKIFVDIIKAELELPDSYGVDSKGNEIPTVFIDSQNITLGTTDKLQIIVGLADAQPYANNNYFDSVTNKEVQEVTLRENIQIDLVSKNKEARQRRWEILAALQSILSKQKQEEFYFKIFKISSSFVNTSEAEGGSQLNRYSIVIPTHVWYRKIKDITPQDGYADCYDTFNVRADDENTINEINGIIDFEIT